MGNIKAWTLSEKLFISNQLLEHSIVVKRSVINVGLIPALVKIFNIVVLNNQRF